MKMKIFQPIFSIAFVLALLQTFEGRADCASIEWVMNEYAFIPILEYVDCNTHLLSETGAHYSYTVNNVLVGSDINLGPSGTDSNYTQGQTVHSGLNKFECTGAYASSGRCIRIE